MTTVDLNYDVQAHDPAFHPFTPWEGTVPPGFAIDWSGIKTRTEFAGWQAYDHDWHAYPVLPRRDDEDYVEWVAMLNSIGEASDCFTMVELGCGWGRWLSYAVGAIRQSNLGLDYRLTGVEADPQHFAWMRSHFEDNGIDTLTKTHLFEAAAAVTDGTVRFEIADPGVSYGAKVADDGGREVEAMSLDTLLARYVKVDHLDLDIQGAELEVLAAGHDSLTNKVRRVFVATHSPQNERGLRDLFHGIDWFCEDDYSLQGNRWTRWGWAKFGDGAQVWVNPRFG